MIIFCGRRLVQKGEKVGTGFRSHSWVDLWRGTNEPEAGEAALVANQTGKEGKARLPLQADRVHSRNTVGDSAADLSPKDGHRIHNGGGGLPYS